MSRILPVTYQLNYKIEFQTAFRRHHIYKDIWVPFFGKNLLCKADTREKAIEYDKSVIGVFKSGDQETFSWASDNRNLLFTDILFKSSC